MAFHDCATLAETTLVSAANRRCLLCRRAQRTPDQGCTLGQIASQSCRLRSDLKDPWSCHEDTDECSRVRAAARASDASTLSRRLLYATSRG